jgi:hypothetical protein
MPSDGAFLRAVYTINIVRGVGGLLTLALVVLLIAVWFKPTRRAVKAIQKSLLLVLLAVGTLAATTHDSRAYYDKADYAEVYFVLPNESAFYIPDVGDNKGSQAKFGSEAYLAENKVAAKRFTIPHTKLENSGLFSNYYVPAGRLIIVDRTPFSREWVAGAHRGSSSKDESFPCQSKEGLDVSVGMSIGTSVVEENAARFLYYFGTVPPQGDRRTPEVIFTSVFFGRSLAQVMDGPVRNKVQSLVCSEFTARTLDEGNAKAVEILASVETKTKAYLDSVGITLSYIGWADTFTFNDKVQDAINRRYVSSQEVLIANTLAPHVGTIQGLANAEAVRTVAGKWNGAVPSSVSLWWLPTGVSDFMTKLISPVAPAR